LFFEEAVTLKTLKDRCTMPSWVEQEWKRLNNRSDETIKRYFPVEASLSQPVSPARPVISSLPANNSRTKVNLSVSSNLNGFNPIVRLPNIGNSCWINAVAGFLMRFCSTSLPGLALPVPSIEKFRSYLFGLRKNNPLILDDWNIIDEQFDSTALITWLAGETFYDQFLCTSRTVFDCSHCGDTDETLNSFPYFVVENNEFNFPVERTLPSVCSRCHTSCNKRVYLSSLSRFILVIVERMRLLNGHPFKDMHHVPFPESFLGKPLLVVGEHTGSDFRHGHWIRHERVGNAFLTVSDDEISPCHDVHQRQTSFLVYGS
jgi:hypothetical protein